MDHRFLMGVYFGKKINELINGTQMTRTLFLILKIKIVGLSTKTFDEIVLREQRKQRKSNHQDSLIFFKYIIQKYKINLNNKNINTMIRYFREKSGKEFILTFLYQRQMSNIS